MPAKEWATPAQKRYLMSKLTAYMAATDISNHKSLHRFWVTLNEGWFELFPVQTTTDLVAIGDEIENTKERLKTWMRYRAARRRRAAGTGTSSGGGDGGGSGIGAALAGSGSGSGGVRASKTRSLFSVLKRTKEIRPYRPIEVYQKVYNLKISQEVMARGYGLLNEETETAAAAAAEAVASASSSVDVVTLTAEEIGAATEKETEAIEARIRKNRQLRMSMRRRAAIELYDAEDDEVKAEIKAEMDAMNAERSARAGGDTDESTPEDYQHAIDQLQDVAEQVLKSIGEATGWHLCLLAGGPMPNCAGAISTKTICYGTTALGSDFQASHPTFDDSVKAHFNKFLKRAFPHEVRDARGIVDNSQEIAGAITIDDEGDDETPAAGEVSKPKPPKRIRHPKRATAAPAPGPAVSPAVLFPNSNVVTVPTDAAILSEPDAIADSPLPIPAGFDETMDAIASEYGASADIPFGWDGAGLDLGGITVHHATFDAAGEDLVVSPPPPSSSPSPAAGGSRTSPPSSDRWDNPVSSPLFRPSVLLQAFTKTPVPMRPTPWGSPSTSVASSAVMGVPNATPPALPSAAASTPPLSSSPFGNAPSTKSPVAAVPQPAAVSTNAHPPSSPLNATLVPLPTPPSTSTRPPVPSRALAFFSASLERHSRPRPSSVAPPTPPTPPSPPTAFPPSQSSPEGEAAAPPGPHYIVSRPMANPPKVPALARSRPRGRPPGRGRGRGGRNQGVSRNDVGAPESAPPVDENSAPMSAAVREESARIHREEAAQRKDRAELREWEKVMEEKKAASTAAAKRRRSPSGGADLVVVERPKRAVKAALNLDGTPVIRPVQRTRAELAGSRVAIGVVDPNVQQAKTDAELLRRLNGKGKGKGTRKAEEAPAPKTRPTKRART